MDVGCGIFLLRRRKPGGKGEDVFEDKDGLATEDFAEANKNAESMHFDLDTIRLATDDFAEANKLGRGTFGVVYKGTLPNRQLIAVKRMTRGSVQGEPEIRNEIVLVSKLQHRNLLRLLGFCFKKKEKILVYEFIPNLSLDIFISDPGMREYFGWETRYRIIEGIAKGILYLHEDSRHKIIHRDLNPSNILIDEEMNPKIANFCLARLLRIDQTGAETSTIAGTDGYMAPEYITRGRFSVKSDLFSFGVIVLEIVSGQMISRFRINNEDENLLTYARRNWNQGTHLNLVDPTLTAGRTSEMARCIHIGLLCVQANEADRPTMSDVVAMLRSSSMTLPVPLDLGTTRLATEDFAEANKNAESMHFDLDTIRLATDDFAEANKLGRGGYGVVYKGTLPDGQLIAAKRMTRGAVQGEPQFRNESVLLAKLQHRNLVRLLGFCSENEERILVYEFIPNLTLDKFISDPVKREHFGWETRYRIIERIAKGILYLHEDSRLKIIHRDLKPSNILIDEEMNPKIADFGTARLFDIDQTGAETRNNAGTYGYMAPEYITRGRFSVKSDLFSFGVIVLEIVSGQRISSFRINNEDENLLTYAWTNWNQGTHLNLVDHTLTAGRTSEMARCIHIGLLCVQSNEADRPTMSDVVVMLRSSPMTLPVPSRPGFCSGSNTLEERKSKSAECSNNEVSISELDLQ